MATKYVSAIAVGANNGSSWADAWVSPASITGLVAGDIVEFDGGFAGRTYTAAPAFPTSGSAAEPIIYRRAREIGRHGRVTFDGGRSLLPNSDESGYANTSGSAAFGLDLGVNRQFLIIDGGRWDGFRIINWGTTASSSGLVCRSGTANIIVRGCTFINNGRAVNYSGSLWRPEGHGMTIGGTNVRAEQCILLDNGVDQLAGPSDVAAIDLVVRDCLLCVSREWSGSVPGVGFNMAAHSDGYQNFTRPWQHATGGPAYPNDRVRFLHCVIGPGISQSFFIGEQATDVDGVNGGGVENFTSYGTLMIYPTHNGYAWFCDPDWGDNHRVERSTIIKNTYNYTDAETPTGVGAASDNSINVQGATGHVVKDNILYEGGSRTNGATLAENSGNVLHGYATLGGTALAGTVADPDFTTDPGPFADKEPLASLIGGHYRPRAAAAVGKGARIWSHDHLKRTGAAIDYLRGTLPRSLWLFGEAPGMTQLLDEFLRVDRKTFTGTITLGVDSLMRDEPTRTAWQLTQSDAQEVSLGDVYHFAGTAAMSFGMLFRADTPPTTGQTHRLFFNIYTDGGGEQGWGFHLNGANGQINFQRRLNTSAGNTAATATGVVAGGVYVIFGTYDGTTMRMYLQGKPDGSAVTSSASLLDGARTTRLFGSGVSGSRPILTANMAGVWDRALTAAEIFRASQLLLYGDRSGHGMLGMVA